MAKFNLQYVFEGELDPEIVAIEGTKGVYDEMDLVFSNPEFSRYMQEWAEGATIGEQMNDDDFILWRVA